MVEEALVDSYNYVINRNGTIYEILKKSHIIAGGAQGHLFEKYVIYNMNPKNKENKCIFLFNSLLVNKNELIEKFLPNDNENFRCKKSKVKIKNLEDGIYLFEKRIFGGKNFDMAIIELITEEGIQEAKVFLFQILMYKDNIYTIKDLLKDIRIMIEYLSIYYSFTIKEENVFFTYIFDISCPIVCLNKCKKRNISYIFYSSQNNCFISSEGYNIESLDNIFICPLTLNLLKFDNNTIKENYIYKVYDIKHKLNNSLEQYIFNVIKNNKDYGFTNDFIKIKYIRSNNSLNFLNNYSYLCIIELKNEMEQQFQFEFIKDELPSYKDIKSIYIIRSFKNNEEIQPIGIFYCSNKEKYDFKVEARIHNYKKDIYDIYEVTSNEQNTDEFDYISEANNIFK